MLNQSSVRGWGPQDFWFVDTSTALLADATERRAAAAAFWFLSTGSG